MVVMAADHGHDQHRRQEPVKGRKHALTEHGESMAERVARLAPGAQVIKAFHLFQPTTGRDLPAVRSLP
jgi:predicted dinucleotide-binding enzyme